MAFSFMYVLSFFTLLWCVGMAGPAYITFGYLRLSGIDSRNTLAGFMTNIKRHNTALTVPNVQFLLDVTTIDCTDDDTCNTFLNSTAGQSMMADFYGKFPTYAAILRPCHLVAPQIIDQAILQGGVPVIDPVTIRAADFASSNVVMFNQYVRTEIARLFTFMQHESGCAVSGVLYDTFSEMPTHVQFAVDLFTNGSLSPPAVLSVDAATDQDIRNFVIHQDSNRRCFLVLATNKVFRRIMVALNNDTAFIPEQRRMYGTSLLNADSFSVGGTNRYAPYAYTNYVRWNPGLDKSLLAVASVIPALVTSWYNAISTADRQVFTNHSTSPPSLAYDSTFQAILVTSFVIESIRSGLTRDKLNGTETAIRIGKSLLNVMYIETRTLSDFPFQKLYKACPPKPMKQICWCNTVTRTSYMFRVNASSGTTFVVWDDEAAGQRDIATISMSEQCGYDVSGWSYPLTGLFLYPSNITAKSGLSAAEVTDIFTLTTAVFGEQIREINYAPIAPARPFRYANLPIIPDSSITTEADDTLQASTASYNPFVVLGSMDERIQHSSILTLYPSIIDMDQSDSVLLPVDSWPWQVINLRPVLADLIHACAGYYASKKTFTGLFVIVTSAAIGALVSKSFATFGYDIPVSSMTVTLVEATWYTKIRGWLSSSANPYVLVASARNPNNCMDAAYRAAVDANSGTLAFATTESVFYSAYLNFTLPSASGTSDIVFASFMSEWWMLSTANVATQLLNFTDNPRYHIASAAIEFTKKLGDSVSYDYVTTAAEVLYQVQTISTDVALFGPFSNLTCTEEQVAANEPDRRCQCTKGVRSLYVHSAHNWFSKQLSTRTNRYKYTMTTCGVKYLPYIPPPVFKEFPASSIAAIAAGGSCFVLAFIIGAFTINYYFFGRNNRAAPKNPSLPFAIVFTDIQSSTALWARAPAAMSEAVDQHHRLMRKALRRNNGYEVKTVGDSFMVAFIDPNDAVNFSLEAQIAFNKSNWSTEIDAIYIELLAEAGIVDDEQGDEMTSKKPFTINDNQSQNTIHSIIISVPENVQMKTLPNNGVVNKPNENMRNRGSVATSMLGTSAMVQESVAPKSTVYSMDTSNSNMFKATKKASNPWHGVRVRIGVHYGMGDIRKDPVSQGYDYYGTVVNTAARVEGVGHGGQILVTDAAYEALDNNYARDNKAVVISLGPQPLRGLDAPIKLHQFVPASLEARRFPPLRLHIEKETDEVSDISTSTAGTALTSKETAEELATRVCAGKQYRTVSADNLLQHYYYLLALFGPTNDSYKATVFGKLGESWGFESASKAARHEATRLRLLISLLAKVTKSFNVATAGKDRRSTGSYHNTMLSGNNNGFGSSHSLHPHGSNIQSVKQFSGHQNYLDSTASEKDPLHIPSVGVVRHIVPSSVGVKSASGVMSGGDQAPPAGGGVFLMGSHSAGSSASLIKDAVQAISRAPAQRHRDNSRAPESVNDIEESSVLLESVIRADSTNQNPGLANGSTFGSVYRRTRELSNGPLQ